MVKKSSNTSVIKSDKQSKFSKNSSLSGVQSKKSPKERRKSLAVESPKLKIKNEEKAHVLKSKKQEKGNSKEKLTKKRSKTSKKNASDTELINDFSELESKYNVKTNDIKNAVEGVIKFASENPKTKNQLFNEQIPLHLQISCFKVPKGYSKILRFPLKNSVLTPDDDVCLIVPDVKGIPNKEHEKHLDHYETLLRNKGVKGIKKIMTFHEFRTEYETFEQKSRLADLYDVFLVDGRISGKVVQKCGKLFYKKRKVPTPVKLHVTKLKEHIDQSLKKAYFHMHLKSDSYVVQFGHSKMNIADLIENVFSIIEGLDKQFPGNFGNIRNIYGFSPRTTSIPIYISLKNPNNVEVPHIKVKKPKDHKSVEGELTTILGNVIVNPSGKVTVKKSDKKENVDSVDVEDVEEVEETEDDGAYVKAAENPEKKIVNKRSRKAKKVHTTSVKPTIEKKKSKGNKKTTKKENVSVEKAENNTNTNSKVQKGKKRKGDNSEEKNAVSIKKKQKKSNEKAPLGTKNKKIKKVTK